MEPQPGVVEFLERAQGQSFCDGCLALELKLPLLVVRDVVSRSSRSIDRRPGACSICGRSIEVTCLAAG